jgi:hypothetical protein
LRPLPGASDQDDVPATLHVVAWPDPVVDELGYDPRSWYVERFWLPVVGPTSTWLLRRLASCFGSHPEGFDVELPELARTLGLGPRTGRNSPLGRAISRCRTFGLVRGHGPGSLAVRRRLPPLPRRHLLNLPDTLKSAHDDWRTAQASNGDLDHVRRRARLLALELLEMGEEEDVAEARLVRWRVHPAVAHESARWARELRAAAREAAVPKTPSPGSGLP